jgi:peptidoglycan/xylan/chitin deacetylase (PgdA/CDA1 family)
VLRKKLKALLGRLAFSLGLHKRRIGDRCLIVAFHRVADDANGSPINCTPQEFRRYCEFLRKHFNVITLAELVERLRTGRSVAGTAVITFDDGYKDNSEFAAPILASLGLPATFFVTTSFVGSETQAFWDADAGVMSRWMTWSDIERLKAQRFDIGCHTDSHVDLGTADVARARTEIEACKEQLERRLGAEVRHFAYPFGGKEHIRPETLALVKAAGFTCCLSCYGGLASRDSDPYGLLREPITTWHDSPHHFAFELLRH